MTYNELTPSAELLRGLEEQVFSELDDAEAQAVKATAARLELKADLVEYLALDPVSPTAALDELATTRTEELTRALTYKSLSLYFTDYDQGEGSVNRSKRAVYSAAYDRIRANFRNLSLDTRRASGVVILER